MSAPGRLAVRAARSLETAAARRTFASDASISSSSRRITGRSTQCLREAQRVTSQAGVAGSSQSQTRSFSQTISRNKLKTIDQIKARNKGGVCRIRSSVPAENDACGTRRIRLLTSCAALQPHGRHPLRRIWCRTMGILHIRERAHGAQADSRADKGHREAQSRRTIPACRSGRKGLHQRRHARQILIGAWKLSILRLMS